MPASPPTWSAPCSRSGSQASSISASRASTPWPACATSSSSARTALDERKVIDRAKGILMEAKTLSEPAAYALLRKTAMNEKKKIAEVAQSVVTGAELLK